MKAIFNLKKTGLLVATAALLFTACKKDKDHNEAPGQTPPPAAAAKLKKVSSDDHMLEFGYNADGSLQTVKISDDFITNGVPTTFNVNYTADKKISELKTNAGFRIVPHYENGGLATADMIDETGEVMLTTRYEYLNGVLKSATGSVQGIEALKFSFTSDADGNVSKTEVRSYNPLSGQLELTGRTDYTYDGKTNPMYSHKALLYLLLQNTPKNNVTKEQTFDGQNSLDETVEYTYTYNNQNLPQSATVKTTAAGQGATTTTLTYSYQ